MGRPNPVGRGRPKHPMRATYEAMMRDMKSVNETSICIPHEDVSIFKTVVSDFKYYAYEESVDKNTKTIRMYVTKKPARKRRIPVSNLRIIQIVTDSNNQALGLCSKGCLYVLEYDENKVLFWKKII